MERRGEERKEGKRYREEKIGKEIRTQVRRTREERDDNYETHKDTREQNPHM